MSRTSRPCRYVILFAFFSLGISSVSIGVFAQDAQDVLRGIFDIVKQAKKLKHKSPPEEPPADTSNDPGPGTTFSVGGMRLGERVELGGSYDCRPSEQFTGFDWCSTVSREREARGAFEQKTSILRSVEGKAQYLNRSLTPAFFGRNEINDDIKTLTRKFGLQPKISVMPKRAGSSNGIIASWGDVTLKELDQSALAALAKGESPKQGLLVDFLNDFATSTKEHLPVYKLGGGAGYVWIATVGAGDRSKLRFLAVDASALQTPAAAPNEDPTSTAEIAQQVGEANNHGVPAPSQMVTPAQEPDANLIAELQSQYRSLSDNVHSKGVTDAEINLAISNQHCPRPYASPSDYRCGISALRAADADAEMRKRIEKMAAQRKRDAEEAEAARVKAEQDAADQRKRDVEAEAARVNEAAKAAAQAKADRAEAETKGLEYAQNSGTSWSLSRKHNEMTDKDVVSVSSSQTNDGGALASVTGECTNDGMVTFKALLVDQEGKPNLSMPGIIGNPPSFVRAKVRVNDFPAGDGTLKMGSFNNEFALVHLAIRTKGGEDTPVTIAQAAAGNDINKFVQAMTKFSDAMYGVLPPLPSAIVWRFMAEIDTDRGAILIKLPLFDRKIRELFLSCGETPREYEVGLPSTPDESQPIDPPSGDNISPSLPYAATVLVFVAFAGAIGLAVKYEPMNRGGFTSDLHWLFLGTEGRITRLRYLKYSLLYSGLLIAALIGLHTLFSLDVQRPRDAIAALLLAILLAYPLLALLIKRMQDRNFTRTVTVVIWLVYIGYLILGDYVRSGADETFVENLKPVVWLLVASGAAIFVAYGWLTAQSIFMRGTIGPNRFGDDPLAKPLQDVPSGVVA